VTINTGDYQGPERRHMVTAADDARLDTALAEIRRLHGAATELASVVARTVPREEAEARERQFRFQMLGLGIAVLVSALFIPLITSIMLGSHFEQINDGQRIISCLLTKTEAERTGTIADTALLACTEKERR
jgi:hypothetical protein